MQKVFYWQIHSSDWPAGHAHVNFEDKGAGKEKKAACWAAKIFKLGKHGREACDMNGAVVNYESVDETVDVGGTVRTVGKGQRVTRVKSYRSIV